MQTVAETPTFMAQAEKLFSDADRAAIIDLLALGPEAGELIPGTGGVRKLRVPVAGRGKRGGARVIYYLLDADAPIYALLVYAKNQATDLSPDGKKAVTKLAAAIKAQHRRPS